MSAAAMASTEVDVNGRTVIVVSLMLVSVFLLTFSEVALGVPRYGFLRPSIDVTHVAFWLWVYHRFVSPWVD